MVGGRASMTDTKKEQLLRWGNRLCLSVVRQRHSGQRDIICVHPAIAAAVWSDQCGIIQLMWD